MKLAVFAHCAIDTITIDDVSYEQVGGSACYCGITARQFKFDVDLYTKFGSDFPKQYLIENNINFINSESEKNTTKFVIDIIDSDRTLKLTNQCDPIEYFDVNADAHLVSPIYHEITNDTLKQIKNNSDFLFVDPQGFMRQKDYQNNIILKNGDIDLTGVNAIKVNPEEAQCIVNGTHDEMMVALQKKGVEYVLLTNKTDVSLLVKDKVYSITLPNKQIHDTTGIGDIFCAAFTCTMLKENDFLWALCFAGGAAQAALDSKNIGLQKIPKKGTIQNNASYFYNLVKFRDL
jgi:sugar/nucleoside kinase (ribokinase family)